MEWAAVYQLVDALPLRRRAHPHLALAHLRPRRRRHPPHDLGRVARRRRALPVPLHDGRRRPCRGAGDGERRRRRAAMPHAAAPSRQGDRRGVAQRAAVCRCARLHHVHAAARRGPLADDGAAAAGGTLVRLSGLHFFGDTAWHARPHTRLRCKFGADVVVASFGNGNLLKCYAPGGAGSVPWRSVVLHGNLPPVSAGGVSKFGFAAGVGGSPQFLTDFERFPAYSSGIPGHDHQFAKPPSPPQRHAETRLPEEFPWDESRSSLGRRESGRAAARRADQGRHLPHVVRGLRGGVGALGRRADGSVRRTRGKAFEVAFDLKVTPGATPTGSRRGTLPTRIRSLRTPRSTWRTRG